MKYKSMRKSIRKYRKRKSARKKSKKRINLKKRNSRKNYTNRKKYNRKKLIGGDPYTQETLFDAMEDTLPDGRPVDMRTGCHQSLDVLRPAFDRLGYKLTFKEQNKEEAGFGRLSQERVQSRQRVIEKIDRAREANQHSLIGIRSPGHTWFLEILPDKRWRILSMWVEGHGFKQFADESPYGRFKTGGWTDFMEELTTIIKQPTSREEVEEIKGIYAKIFIGKTPWEHIHLDRFEEKDFAPDEGNFDHYVHVDLWNVGDPMSEPEPEPAPVPPVGTRTVQDWLESVNMDWCHGVLVDLGYVGPIFGQIDQIKEADEDEVVDMMAAVQTISTSASGRVKKFKRELAKLRGLGETFA